MVLSPKALVDRERQAAVERFLSRSKEGAEQVEARLKKEGKTWDDLEEMIVEEVRAVRKERAASKKQRVPEARARAA